MAKNIDKLITENLGYVKATADQYKGRGLDFEDLVAEGNMAMLEATQKFDESKNTKFVAYAGPFIRKAMEEAIKQQAGLYRIPKNASRSVKKIAQPQSLDAPLSASNQYTLLDIIASTDAEMGDEKVNFHNMVEDLMDTLYVLDDREKQVIKSLYGLGCARETMAEVGEDMQLKRERVRQIRDKAIRKIGKKAKNAALRAFLRR